MIFLVVDCELEGGDPAAFLERTEPVVDADAESLSLPCDSGPVSIILSIVYAPYQLPDVLARLHLEAEPSRARFETGAVSLHLVLSLAGFEFV